MEKCELCERKKELTFHHLIPKKTHSKKWCQKMFTKDEMHHRGINVCRDCHVKIHLIADHNTLAKSLNTKEALMEHPDMVRFLIWVKKQRKKAKK